MSEIETNGAGSGKSVNDQSGAAWASPGNITANDDTNTTCLLTAGEPLGDTLEASTFGFSIPWDAEILGVKLTVRRLRSDSGTIKDHLVQLIIAGTRMGDDNTGIAAWTGTEAAIVYGSSSDTWGLELLGEDVNKSTFGAAFRAQRTGGIGNATAEVDYIEMEITYVLGDRQPNRRQVIRERTRYWGV